MYNFKVKKIVFLLATLLVSFFARSNFTVTSEKIQEVVTKIFDFEVIRVSFGEEMTEMTPTEQATLIGFLKAKQENHPRDGQLIIATWSDNILPVEPLCDLSSHDKRLANARSKQVRKIVDEVLSDGHEIIEVEMTSPPLSDWTTYELNAPSFESDLKKAFLSKASVGKYMDHLAHHLKKNGGASCSVLMWVPPQKS